MISRTFVTCVLTLACVVSFSHTVMATMGGIANVGPVFVQGDSSTAIRELVEFEKSGELLVARPQHDLVAMITLYAPGLSHGHLILRELMTQEGDLTLLLTAPDSVTTRVQRVTIYTRGLQENVVLFESVNGVWEKRLPQSLIINSSADGDMSTQTLRAFSLRKLGFYWLLESSSATSPSVFSHNFEATSARMLLGGKFMQGLLPSIFGVMFLLLFGILSWYIHKNAKLHEW